jgi:hypothetical protein
MHPIIEKSGVLDRKLAVAETSSLGLSSGKTGFCLYFYRMSRLTNNQACEDIAGQWIEAIVSNIDSLKAYDIKQGLAGVALGIDYLIDNRFVKGDSNRIVKDVDTELFKQLSYPENRDRMDVSVQLQFLYYFIVRMKKQKPGSEQHGLFRELIIQTINNLSSKTSFDIYDEPLLFDTDYLLPQYLFALSRCMNWYANKIYRIMEELSPFLLSKLPFLHANRLYLLWAIDAVSKSTGIKELESHGRLLRKELDVDRIIHEELPVRNIYFKEGFPAVYLLIKSLPDYFSASETEKYAIAIVNTIIQSPEWDFLLRDDDYFGMKNGLFDGYCGTSLLLHYHENRFK